MSKIVVANDHGAVELTERIAKWLVEQGHEVKYLGTPFGITVDYPDLAATACKEYLKGGYDFGILCCGTGVGMSIVANKINGIRCALPMNCKVARLAKEHNAANFLAFGGRVEYPEAPERMLLAYMNAEVDHAERHERRRAKVRSIENAGLIDDCWD